MSARHRGAARITAVILAAAGTTILAVGSTQSHPPRSTATNAQWIASFASGPAANADTTLERSVPTYLDMPTIGVHTPLIELGLNTDGTVEVPPLSKNAPAGWYRNLASPGENGPAALLGHVDSANDGPAVFYRIGSLAPGDPIRVRRADGTTAIFTVVEIAQYPKAAFPTQAVYGPLSYPGLRLITCGGSFDYDRHSYQSNIVVYATLIASHHAPISAPEKRIR